VLAYKRMAAIAIVVMVVIVASFLIWGDRVETWTRIELDGQKSAAVALIGAGLLALDIFLPIPSSLVSVLMGSAAGFVMGTVAAAIGLSGGCALGYWFGRYATRMSGPSPEKDRNRKVRAMLDRYGLLALVLLRPVPVLAETSVILAGAANLSFGGVMLVSTLANIGIAAAYAGIGSSVPFGSAIGVAIGILAVVAAPKIAKFRPGSGEVEVEKP
jgi:uncharacterized membrane protein YdjX (TVP38/TMEM64 family)